MPNEWRLDGNAVAATDFLGTTNAQPLSVRTAGTERLRILSDGKVGIGTSSPAVKVDVTGNRIRLESGGKRLDMRADGNDVDVQSDTHNLFLHSSGPAGRNNVIINPFGNEGNVGVGTGAPTDKLHVVGNVRANDVILACDARLKTAIRPMRGALRKLKGLRGVEFAWADVAGGPSRGAGVVAQEVESVAPELVHPERNDRHKGVNAGGLLGMLVEAFKELEAENRALRRRIEAVERAATAGPVVLGSVSRE